MAQLYKCRWQVELFFKWIKQHLRIKAFFGTSDNAVKTQIWIAISVYVLVAIVKKRLHLEPSLYTILQVLGLTLFEKMPIKQALSGMSDDEFDSINNSMAVLNNWIYSTFNRTAVIFDHERPLLCRVACPKLPAMRAIVSQKQQFPIKNDVSFRLNP